MRTTFKEEKEHLVMAFDGRLGLIKKARPKGSHVYLTGVSDDLRQVFDETGFTALFEML